MNIRDHCFKFGPLYGYHDGDYGWFRIFGYGLKYRNVYTTRASFLERMKIENRIIIGKWSIAFLRKGSV